MLVYCITNKVNGKKYIGMTKRTLRQRWNSHCIAAHNGSPFRFHSAIRKYGKDAFEKTILFNDLNIEECRTIEAECIEEYHTLETGYNAHPGGGGGFVVKEENYDEWIINLSISNTLTSNGRWSGYSDEFILDECEKLFKEYKDPEEFSFLGILRLLREKYEGIPKSFSKNRFKYYSNSFKIALANKLDIPLEELERLSQKKSKKHKHSLSKCNTGNSWYSNHIKELSIQSKTHPGDGWVKGRNYGNKN